MSTRTRPTYAAAALTAGLLLASPSSRAADLFWQGGAGDITDANYYSNGTTGHSPSAGDALYIGENGTVTGLPTATPTLTVGKLYVGHANTGGSPEGLPGPGIVTLSAGAFTASTGSGGTANFATIVGFGNTGTLNVDGAATTYSSNRMLVGYGNDLAQSATLNITNAPVVSITGGNLAIGDSPDQTVGIPGHVNVNATSLEIKSILQVGIYANGSSYAQTGGDTTCGNFVIGLNGTDNCSFTMAGGTLKTTATSNVSNGAAALAENTIASFTGGTSTLTGFNVANGLANNTTLAVSGAATLNVTGDLSVTTNASAAATANTFMTLADTAAVNVSSNFFFGRGSTANTQLTITGGALTVGNNFYVGNAIAATGIVINHSAGSVTTQNILNSNNSNPTNFSIGETNTGDATYNLSGTATVTTVARGVVGRQHGAGNFNQSGGAANFNNSLHVGDSQSTSPDDYATGTYNLSGGTLAVSLPADSTIEAFSIAPAGTGTFRVIGSGATMSVTGNMSVYANTNGGANTGTLAFQLEPGESLTTINVSGTATFNPGSALQLDFNAVKPVFGVYTVLSAADIINSGLTPSLPDGWSYKVTPAAAGKLLQFFAGDLSGDGTINADDYALMDRNNAKHLTGGANGDFNADGAINAEDYLLIDQAFAATQSGSLSPDFLAARAAEFGPDYVSSFLATLPEPSLLLPLAVCLPVLSRRRRC